MASPALICQSIIRRHSEVAIVVGKRGKTTVHEWTVLVPRLREDPASKSHKRKVVYGGRGGDKIRLLKLGDHRDPSSKASIFFYHA